jgi:transposase
VFAGGNKLGLTHNQYLKVPNDVPMSNLFVTMLNKMGVDTPVFKDSTGELLGVQA